MNTESKILAGTLHNARQLTQFYLKHTQDVDVKQRFTLGDFTTNNIHWIVAHLAWAEDYLVLKGVGDLDSRVEWLRHFRIGSGYPDSSLFPAYEETLETFHDLHRQTITLLENLPDTALDEKNHVGLKFGSGDTKRSIINHSIRHEGMHCGHLGWLLRMHGKKVI